MTAEKVRFEAAIRLEIPDRTPVAPLLDFATGRWTGITNAEFLFNEQSAFQAMDKAWLELGGWDAIYNIYYGINAGYSKRAGMMEVRLPGEELPPDSQFQWVEKGQMTLEDYDVLDQKGFDAFYIAYLLRVHPGMAPADIGQGVQTRKRLMKQNIEHAGELGIPAMVGAGGPMSFEVLSLVRGFAQFVLDMRRMPQKVERAMEVITTAMLAQAKASVAEMGVKRAFFGAARCSGSFMSPKDFERFLMPYLERTVAELWKDGIVSLLHFDSDWTVNLPFLKRLPRGSCILNLDSGTDIFKAKEVLRDHMCIMGDVPPSLISMGTPPQVTEYCKKLIDVVGEGGGFILSSGCSVPLDGKKENVKAMIDVAKNYRPRWQCS